jgi:hypothetical protein
VLNNDLVSHRSDINIVWEMKYLKKPCNQRITRDLVKLAMAAAAPGYHRIFLAAYNGNSKSSLIDTLSGTCKSQFALTTTDTIQLTRDGRKEPLSGDDLLALKKYLAASSLHEMDFDVEYLARGSCSSENTVIFSVVRADQKP